MCRTGTELKNPYIAKLNDVRGRVATPERTAGEIVTGARCFDFPFGYAIKQTAGKTLTATGDFSLKLFFILPVKYG